MQMVFSCPYFSDASITGKPIRLHFAVGAHLFLGCIEGNFELRVVFPHKVDLLIAQRKNIGADISPPFFRLKPYPFEKSFPLQLVEQRLVHEVLRATAL